MIIHVAVSPGSGEQKIYKIDNKNFAIKLKSRAEDKIKKEGCRNKMKKQKLT